MDSDSDCGFGFAFNNVLFSDRLLRIEIINGGEITNDDPVQDRKRIRKDVKAHGVDDENECYWGMSTNPPTPRIKELHISSAILAGKSPFFYKLFANGMIESQQKHITLRIEASEEAAVMGLLSFIYTNSLSFVTEVPALLRVLIAADKFEVASCMKYCTRLLLSMTMSLNYILLILDLPSTVLLADSVKPLTNAARQYLATHYKDISKFPEEEVMDLPLVAIKALLMSDDLMIASEDAVYEYVLKWAKTNYSVLEERQEVLSNLARYIRFPHMTCFRLKKILTSDDFTPSVASNLVLEALLFKAESQHHRATIKSKTLDHRFVERAYIYRPIKIVEFEVPHRNCIVYLDLQREECNALYPSNQIQSQMFYLGGQGFILSASCNKDQLNGFHSFELFLLKQEKGSVSLAVDYEFSAMWNPSGEFAIRGKGKYNFTGVESIGQKDFFPISWDRFIAKDFPFFINDILRLRAELSICL